MLSELLKFFSLLDELDRSADVELERAALEPAAVMSQNRRIQ
jgi:hypothetical protein